MRTFARFRTRWSASTAAALLATGSLCGAQAQAQTPSEGRFPITEEQRRAAEQVAQAGVPLSALAADAPERYTVKSGDTLWSISALFLASPWRWPELWGMNKEQVNNPHLIYPGQTMVLLKGTDGRATLRLAEESGGSSLPGAPGDAVRLSPQVRDLGTANGRAALASIPANVIEPFLSRPMIVGATELNAFPRVVATQEGRVFVGRGDTAYARGLTDPRIDSYHVFRPANPLYDPDDTARKRPLAYEAFYLGIAQVAKPGEVATLRIQDTAGAGTAAGRRELRAARTGSPGRGPRPVGLRRRGAGRHAEHRGAEPRPPRWPGSRPRAVPAADWRNRAGPHLGQARDDQAAGRGNRPHVRVPRVRQRQLRAGHACDQYRQGGRSLFPTRAEHGQPPVRPAALAGRRQPGGNQPSAAAAAQPLMQHDECGASA